MRLCPPHDVAEIARRPEGGAPQSGLVLAGAVQGPSRPGAVAYPVGAPAQYPQFGSL
ncbi:hypothetical protein ACFQV8_14005 [Pseudonocardia benzenivorans]